MRHLPYLVQSVWASQIYLWLFDFRLKPIYTTVPGASKNDAQFKKGQN